MFDEDDDYIDYERMQTIELARKYNRGTKEEIQLYEELSLALELIKDDSFKVLGSRICDGIDFSIVTQYPNGLPYNVGTLFFNINPSFSVQIKETPMRTKGIYYDYSEMNYSIKIKNCTHR